MAETSLVMQGFDGESIAEKEDVFVFGGAGALDYERVDGAAKFSYAVVQTETWGGYAVYMYNPNTVDVPRQPINCASATSLSFRYKVEAPSAGRVQLRLILMDCGDDSCLDDQSLEEHWYSFFDVLGDDSGEWRTASIAPETLTYTGWSGSADGNRAFDASTIMRWDLQWSIDGFGDVGSEEAGVVWVDDVACDGGPELAGDAFAAPFGSAARRGWTPRADSNATVGTDGLVISARDVGANGDAEATFALPPPAFYRFDAAETVSFRAAATAAGAGVSLAVDGAVAVEADLGADARRRGASTASGDAGSEEAGVVWVDDVACEAREVGANGDAEATFALPPPAFYRLDAVTAISFLATATAAGAGVSLAVDGAVAVEADAGAAATEVSGSWSGGEITGYTVAATRLGTDGAAATFADGSRAEVWPDLFDDGAAPADAATGADALYAPNVNYVDGLDAKWILKKITPDTPFRRAATPAAACAEWCHLIRDCDYFTHDARNDGVCWTFGDVAATVSADAPGGFMSGAYSALNIFFANLRVFFVVSKMNVEWPPVLIGWYAFFQMSQFGVDLANYAEAIAASINVGIICYPALLDNSLRALYASSLSGGHRYVRSAPDFKCDTKKCDRFEDDPGFAGLLQALFAGCMAFTGSIIFVGTRGSMGPAVADDNVAAHYSSDAEGCFWRRFVAALPNYYEWLAVAADDDVATLRDAVGALIAHGVHEDAPGRSDAIIKEDRVAVARCLTLADGGLRRAFFSVVDAVAPTPHRAPDEIPRGYDRGRRRGDMLFALRGDSHLDDELLKRTDSFELIDDDPSPRFPGAPSALETRATVPTRVPSLIQEEPGERAPRRRSDPAAKRRASL
ncbi:hypothetical protein SO694_00148039 [Aureococcus anophagefferens]|uniref:Apple domain-containing protein n=1 Tax=Aureococcus anophagefferens TaxID=44056 RepID=A0ABR1FNK0_AURAN